jgi:hypothetical protein
MKKVFVILLAVVLLWGCSTKLGKQFYTNTEDILFQQLCVYTPNECSMTKVYSGVLAIVGDELIFDVKSQSARPFAPQVSTFQINKNEIKKIELSDKKSFGNKSLTIQTHSIILQTLTNSTDNHCFQIKASDAEKIYEIILDWIDAGSKLQNRN